MMRVLVVEDDRRIRRVVVGGLRREMMTVDEAVDGQEGFDMAVEGKYEVVVLDLMLPKLDGMEVCKLLREEGVSTPILMLTARDGVEDRVEGLNTGADDYLPKPFAFEELVARIKALARRPAKVEAKVIKIGDLEIDMVSNVVKRGGRVVNLTRQEFALLDYLVRHKGQVVSAEKLSHEAWSFDSDVLPNTAQMYVSYLRAKLDKEFPKLPSLIKTVRGFGYKLVVSS